MSKADEGQRTTPERGVSLWLGLALILLVGVIIYGFETFFSPQKDKGAIILNEIIDSTSPRTNRLFRAADPAVYQLARKIEREEPISADEVANLPEGALNARYGSDITLLFHALSSYNLQAIDILLGGGASPYMTDQAEYSERDFTYYLGVVKMHSRPDLGQDFKTDLIRLYLKHGGDPNHRLPGEDEIPFFYYVALMENYDGVRVLLDAGANPLVEEKQGGSVVAQMLAGRRNKASRDLARYIVCRGYFDSADKKSVIGMLRALAPTGPTNLAREEAHRKMAMRILRFHPDIDETDWSVKEIFGDSIPWKEILDADFREFCNEQ